MTNSELLKLFKTGEKTPLLTAVKTAPQTGTAAGAMTQDMNYPTNDLYLYLEAAYADGDLTAEQFAEIESARSTTA